jgi:hypothetical protein
MGLRVFFIAGLLIAALTPVDGGAVESCQSEANRLVRELIESAVFDEDYSPLEPNIRQLQQLGIKKCFDPVATTKSEESPEGFTSLYFNLETMEPNRKIKDISKRNWQIQQKRLELSAAVGSREDYEKLARELDYQFVKYKPEGVQRPSINAPAPAEDETKSRFCQPLKVNIRQSLPPIRNQGGSGWCDFYMEADLLSFKLQKNISAAYLGSLLSPTGRMGSGAREISALIKNQGLCLEKNMPSNNLPSVDGNFPIWVGNFEQRAKNFATAGNPSLCKLSRGIRVFHSLAGLNDILSVVRLATENGNLKETGVVEFPGDAIYPQGINVRPSYLAHLALKTCENDRKDLRGVAELDEVSVSKDPVAAFAEINKVLDRGQPAGIAYDFNQLTDGRRGRHHSSSLVDRRFSGGRCQFLVRNSWGKSSCTRVIKEQDACAPPGYFWVDATNLMKSVSRVIYAK